MDTPPAFTPPPAPSRRHGNLPLLLLVLVLVFLVYRQFSPRFLRGQAEPRAVTPRGDLSDDEKTTIEIFENASPSVVYITSVAVGSDRFGLNVFEIPQGTGSGFIWDAEGHVVTNFHVIENANAVDVTLSDQTTKRARFVGADPDRDLAVLHISSVPGQLRPIPVGTTRDLRVGQKVFAIGNPFGLDQTLTTGIVSALGRSIRAVTGRTIEDVIQTDAAINPGNSGGPLLDSAGRLIGVNTAIYSPSGSSAGIGFAVPVDTVNRIVPQLIRTGRVERPRIGIVMAPDSIVRQLDTEGVLILEVEEGSGAATAGLRGTRRARDGGIRLGDVIVGFDDRKIESADHLLSALEQHKPGDTIELTILRDNATLQVQVTLQ